MRKLSIIALLAGLTAIVTSPLHAGEVDRRFYVESRSDSIAEVVGVVCAFCAYGTRKNLERVSGIDYSRFKKGMEFDTSNGVIKLAIDAAQPIDAVGIDQAIRDGGYELINLHCYVEGIVEESGGDTVLTDVRTGQKFRLVDEQGGRWVPSGPGDGPVAVRGAISAEVLQELASNELAPLRVVWASVGQASSSARAGE